MIRHSYLDVDELCSNQASLLHLIKKAIVKAASEIVRIKAVNNGKETQGFSLLPCDECGKQSVCVSKELCLSDMQLGNGLSAFVEKGEAQEIRKKIKRSPPNGGVGWGKKLRNESPRDSGKKITFKIKVGDGN